MASAVQTAFDTAERARHFRFSDLEAEGWQPFVARHAAGLSLADIEALAEAIGKQVGYEPGSDLRSFVRRIGGNLSTSLIGDLSDASPTGLYVRSASTDFLIAIPAASSSRFDQFMVAKALAHYFLHFRSAGHSSRRKVENGDISAIEQEAVIFAVTFLMPSAAFEHAFARTGGDIAALAAHFRVPVAVAEVRVKRFSVPIERAHA
ncbi:ImmA/IrrE family metallo-endopeptidase [Sphingopyxis sp. YR583]|uniref:ImmA/IrrE family metallo-endopeptidase n=1 Tax=Sphingopyxis sp. YR583 TaxID=1881047 RepID=UPI0015A6807B|nr:ImmA/IrrE family metallo-endopeptidase [Sphingopyxis sp. YR583]